jgi:predicted anti-sigma-YlaC factor YlaD
MDCAKARELMDDALDGTIASSDLALLSDHLGGCERCREEMALARSIDRVLGAEIPARAPAWLGVAVSRAIVRREETLRLVQTSLVTAGIASAIVGTWLALRTTLAGVDLSGVEGGAGRLFAPVAARLSALSTPTPGLPTSWSGNPGVFGVALALAAVSTAFIAVMALRSAKELVHEWH